MTRQRIRRGVFRAIADLQAAIHAYLAEHNASPKPFIWTQSAQAILAKLRRITVSGRTAVIDAWRRRAIRQDKFASLIGISRPSLSNILAGRFGASPQTAERIAEIIATTPAFERQPFLPGLAA